MHYEYHLIYLYFLHIILDRKKASFSELVKENMNTHTSAQIAVADLAIDKGLTERVEEKTTKKMNAAKEELAWVCEKKELLLNNLKKR